MKSLIMVATVASVLAVPSQVSALPNLHSSSSLTSMLELKALKPETPSIKITKPKDQEPKSKPAAAVKAEPVKPEPVVYTVIEGDNLSKIASNHSVEWQRIYAKNMQLEHPDRINVGDKLTIPAADEVLQRDIPAAVSLPAVTPGVIASTQPAAAPAAPAAPSAPAMPAANYGGGNTYDYGYCTWYVKNKRGGSIPNMLGNANTWYSRAAAQGMSVGSVPRAGAVATTTAGAYGHVAYVESVNADGSINISEMNAPVWGQVSYRTASASEFLYIY